VLDYWREVGRATGYRYNWKKVLVWLRKVAESELMVEECEQVMAGLSCFPWNGGNCTVHDITSLLTGAWLSDWHMDYVLTKISKFHHNHYGTESSNHHIFLPVIDVDSIVKAYKGSIHSGNTNEKREQFLEVENKIIEGLIDSVAGTLHLPGHWTSLVIRFNPPKILFGNSLGYPMPSNKATPVKKWICHMLRRSGREIEISDISIFPLETGMQEDSDSCGLFALNAIGHHYLQWQFPLLESDSISQAKARINIALEILQDDHVSIL
jgi:Ulp1 family protease